MRCGVQCSVAGRGTVLRGTVQCRRVRYSVAGYRAVSRGAVQCCGVQGSVAGCGIVLRYSVGGYSESWVTH